MRSSRPQRMHMHQQSNGHLLCLDQRVDSTDEFVVYVAVPRRRCGAYRRLGVVPARAPCRTTNCTTRTTVARCNRNGRVGAGSTTHVASCAGHGILSDAFDGGESYGLFRRQIAGAHLLENLHAILQRQQPHLWNRAHTCTHAHDTAIHNMQTYTCTHIHAHRHTHTLYRRMTHRYTTYIYTHTHAYTHAHTSHRHRHTTH